MNQDKLGKCCAIISIFVIGISFVLSTSYITGFTVMWCFSSFEFTTQFNNPVGYLVVGYLVLRVLRKSIQDFDKIPTYDEWCRGKR